MLDIFILCYIRLIHIAVHVAGLIHITVKVSILFLHFICWFCIVYHKCVIIQVLFLPLLDTWDVLLSEGFPVQLILSSIDDHAVGSLDDIHVDISSVDSMLCREYIVYIRLDIIRL